ncbi:uncharacterized protein E0L32_008592 [Thyridium curvatum]|uniref:Uncharacterized protein n=1 Tax=Thyridium curvatum TaxID=1093900 RepID=A0A507ALG0_9PEZI|nr:uncharacterized protein E0L32_008592 [Thyridium curvatum]TPX10542.1 hypothetical protein E0L32_008592 [Thyridium curvatum]
MHIFEDVSKYNVQLSLLERVWASWYLWMQNDTLATGLISFAMHEIVYFGRSLPWIIIDAIPMFNRWKIQKSKVPTVKEQVDCALLVLLMHFTVELPQIWVFHPLAHYFGLDIGVPFPSYTKMALQICLFFVMEDAWHYFFHRGLHYGPFYKNIHKLHHTYSAPFGLAAEYASPIEVMLLGFGVVGTPVVWVALTGDLHLFTMFMWIVLRLFQAIDAHSGYDFPWSLRQFIPVWGGAEFHDLHHEKFIGNYASSFRWWDWIFDTEAGYEANKKRRERRLAAIKAKKAQSFANGTNGGAPLGNEVQEVVFLAVGTGICTFRGGALLIRVVILEAHLGRDLVALFGQAQVQRRKAPGVGNGIRGRGFSHPALGKRLELERRLQPVLGRGQRPAPAEPRQIRLGGSRVGALREGNPLGAGPRPLRGHAAELTLCITMLIVTKDTMAGDVFGIQADLLIPGRGEPIKDGAVIIKGKKIEWAGRQTDLPEEFYYVTKYYVPVLMPGMWDCHTHFMGTHVVGDLRESFKQFLPGRETLIGAVIVDDLEATLMAGFTSIRELGGFAGDLVPAIEKGRIAGPTVYGSMGILSITGGHGDLRDEPLSTMVDCCNHGGKWMLCDGEEECIKRLRQLMRRGAKVVKICSTGGVLSLGDQPEDSQFSPKELRAMVEEAARSSRVVASHAIGKNGIMDALRAGVRTIEHGMYLDDEVVALMKEKGAILVPTRHIVETLNLDMSELPPEVREKVLRMTELSRSSLRMAVREGVKIALGTDTYSSDRSHICSHGTNARELHWAVEAGMTPLQAIEMATAMGPETVGAQAPKTGMIREGYDADIIAVASSPLEDIDVLTKPRNITHVWKGGRLYKSP